MFNHLAINNVAKFGGWYKVCIWEKIIIPEIKNANIVITELYNRIHYLSILPDERVTLFCYNFNKMLILLKKLNF